MSRHRLRYVLPSCERTTFLFRSLWSCHSFTEYEGLGIDNFLTNLKDSLVRIDSEFSCYLNVVSRHCLGQAFPTGECIALLLGISLSSQRRAVFHLESLILSSVHLIIKHILVDGIRT